MNAAELAILIKAKDEASKVIDDVGEHSKGLGSQITEVGKIAAGVFAAGVMTQGLSAVTGAIGDSIAGWKEHKEVVAQTEAVLKSTGGAAGVSAGEIEDMANALKLNSTFSDDAIQSGENLLLTFTGIGKDVFPRATQVMADMSQALGQDLKSSAVQLGKALNDPIRGMTALQRVGVSFTEEQKEAVQAMQEAGDVAGAQALILAELEKEFGGSAKAASDAAGASEKYADRMDDLQDTIGEKLLPIQEKWKEAQVAVISFLVDVALPAIQSAAEWIGGKLGPAFDAVAQVVSGVVVPALASLGKWFTEHQEVIAAAAIVIGTVLVVAFGAWAVAAGAAALATLAAIAPIVAIGLAATALVAGIILLVKHWDDLTARYPILGQASDEIKAKFTEFVGWITGTFVPAVKNIADTIADAVRTAVDFVRGHWDEIRAVIEPAMDAVLLVIQSVWAQIQTVFEVAVGIIKGVVDVFMGVFTGDWQRAWDGVKEIVGAAWTGIKDTISHSIDLIKGLAPLMLNAGSALGEALLNGLKNALSATAGFAGDVGSAVLSAVRGAANGLIDQINRALEISFDTHIPGVGVVTINPLDIGHLAKGTEFWRGGPTWVGERGPEILDLPRGSRVLSHEDSMELTKRGDAPVFNVTVNIDGREYTGEMVKVAIEQQNRRHRRDAALSGI